MVRKKRVDHKEEGLFEGNLERRIKEILDPGYFNIFEQQMSRFLDQKTRQHMADMPNYSKGVIKAVATHQEESLNGIKRGPKEMNPKELGL
ncbi:hypothetical protein [Marinobacter sp. V034]|uniref:hypothetical protein n=1 Tax=Marinobacter sp. V034 TaxID=3459610 RepID=UPI004044EF93